MTDSHELIFGIPAFKEWLVNSRVISSKPPFSTWHQNFLEELLSYESDFDWAIDSIEAAKLAEPNESPRYLELLAGETEAKRLQAISVALSSNVTAEAIELERVLAQFDERFLLERKSEPRVFLRLVIDGSISSNETVERLRSLYNRFRTTETPKEKLEELLSSIDTYDVMYSPA